MRTLFVLVSTALTALALSAAVPGALGSTILTASQETTHQISFAAINLQCETLSMQGTSSSAELEEFELSPHGTECKAGEEAAKLEPNGCGFVLTSGTAENESEEVHAPLQVSCPEEAQLTIVIPSLGNCKVTIAPQTSTDGVSYSAGEDEGAANVTITTTASFAATRDKGNFLCNLLPTEGIATYSGTSLLRGYEDVLGEEGEREDIEIATAYLLTGAQETTHQITYAEGAFQCETLSMQGTSSSAAEEFELSPHGTECKFSGLLAELEPNGCGFVLTSGTVENESEEVHAPLQVSCPEETQLTIVIPSLSSCKVTIAPQTSTDGVSYSAGEDEGAANVTITTTASFAATRDEGSFLCNLLPTEGTATYSGTSLLKGYEDILGEEGEREDIEID